MIVDSTALTEQVVDDIIISAFQSAGQRCSALRILCLQDEIYERTIDMLLGAMDQLVIGDPETSLQISALLSISKRVITSIAVSLR